MTLIIILISLAALYYIPIVNNETRYHLFHRYAAWLTTWLPTRQMTQAWVMIAVIILPILVVLAMFCVTLSSLSFGLFGIVINALVLWYCLLPLTASKSNIGHQQEEASQKVNPYAQITVEQADDCDDKQRFCHANDRTFAVLFWFVILGGFGAVLYRLIALLACMSEGNASYFKSTAKLIQQVLDWLPARLLGLTYLIVGNFTAGFSAWIQHLLQGLDYNQTLLMDAGEAAWGPAEKNNAKSLIERALIVWLVIIAIFIIGAWLY
ncbi:MAG: hypothetical protein JKY13_01710 [Gammaproteobacteria bacterium]|nr:hypothetical protein [Gammaproteobacteria bacterium]